MLAAQGRSERLRDGLVVAISGPPNVGKSTLINHWRGASRDVSPHAGTTRDIIEVQLDLDGYPVTVIDTAEFARPKIGGARRVRRARARAAEADWCCGWSCADEKIRVKIAPTWMVRNKIDLDLGGAECGTCGCAAGIRPTD